MSRFFVTYILPLALPTLLYLLWVLPAMRRAKKEGRDYPVWEETPWLLLFAAGVILLFLILFLFSTNDGGPPWAEYTPPHMEDGVLVPAEIADDIKE